ncbi:uncharacterized protein [Narcine bancroftii]|uniref:uncharacterized protein isoform X2 n=1 Tax=Narcine bancroftii TaxID=1343680 RepID=UPI003831BA70
MEKTQAAKQQKGWKKRLTRIFQRSKSTGEQVGEDAQTEAKEGQAAGRRRARSWGSWRQKKRCPEPWVPSTPLLLGGGGEERLIPARSFTSLQVNDCIQVKQATLGSKLVFNYDQIVDAAKSTELEIETPTGKTAKFANFRFPSSGKAEEGKRSQVRDYFEGIFGSGKKKTSKPPPSSSSAQESPTATNDLNSAQNSPSNVQDSVFSEVYGSEGLVEAEAPDQNPGGLSAASPGERCLLAASDDTLNSPETSSPGPESVGHQLRPSEAVHGNPINEFFSDTPLQENTSQHSHQQEGNAFVNRDRLTEGSPSDECADTPVIKESVLPISETVRIEQRARVAELDIHPPKNKVDSNVKLSETSVSLPVNSIDVELKGLENEAKQLNHSVFQEFKKEIGNYSIPEKTYTCDLVKRQTSPKNAVLASAANENKVEETGTSCVTHIGNDTANLLRVEWHSIDNPPGENLSGLVEQESNTAEVVTNSQIDVGNSKNSVEKFDLNSVSFEMDKKSPSNGKRGGRKGKKKRSLKSDQSARSTETNTFEEPLKENDSNMNEVSLTQQSPEVPVEVPPSPEQDAHQLIHSKTLPETALSAEKSAQGVSKPFASRKKPSQRLSFSPTSSNEVESPVKETLGKTSHAETQFGSPETVKFTHRTIPYPGQRVEGNTGKGPEGAVDGFADELGENMIGLDPAKQNNCVETMRCISNQQNVNVGNLNVNHSMITQNVVASSERLKSLKICNSKGKSSNKNLITSQLHSTMTTRIRIPSIEKEGEFNDQISPSHQLKCCTEIQTEEEETIRITLPKKLNATSHHQVDFFTTKDLPLASNVNKTCVGSLKIQIQNKSARQADGNLTIIGKRQQNTTKKVGAASDVSVATRRKADEISQVKADESHRIFAEVHRNEGGRTTGVCVENASLKPFVDVDTSRSEENCSTEAVSLSLNGQSDLKSQSFVDTQTSGRCFAEIEKGVTSKSIKKQVEPLDTAACPLAPAVPFPGAELQNEKVALLPNILISENKEETSAKNINGNKTIMTEHNPELGHQNKSEVEDQVLAANDPALPQIVEALATVLPAQGEKANHDHIQGGRSSNVAGEIPAQQSPLKFQPVEDAALPQSSQVSKTVPEIEQKGQVKTDDERSTDTSIGIGKFAHQGSPVLHISGSKAKASSPQPEPIFGSTKSDTNTSCVIGHQECLDTSATEGALTAQVGLPQIPLQVGPMNSGHRVKETSLSSSLCEQTSEISADVSANIISDAGSGSNKASLGSALPLQLNVSMLQNDGSEVNEKMSLKSIRVFQTMEAVIINEASANCSNEQINNLETKNVQPQGAQVFESTVSEIEKSAMPYSEALATDGAREALLNSAQTQPGKAVIKDELPHCVEISETQNEASCFNEQKSGTEILTGNVNVKEINSTVHVGDQEPKIETDNTSANTVGDTESTTKEVTLEVALPFQGDTPTLQNNGSEIRETKNTKNQQAFETVEVNDSKGESVDCSHEEIYNCKEKNASPELRQTFKSTVSEMENSMNLNPVIEQQGSSERATADDALSAEFVSTQADQNENNIKNVSPQRVEESTMITSAESDISFKQGTVNLPFGESEENDASVRLQASMMVPVIEKPVPVKCGDGTVFDSTQTKWPLEQNPSLLENRGFDASETVSSQSMQVMGAVDSNLNLASSAMAFSKKKNSGSEVSTSKFDLPLLSSTPKVQQQEMEQKSEMSALSLETTARNLFRATGSDVRKTEPGAPTNKRFMSVQDTEESQPSNVIVNETFVINDTSINEAILDLDSTATGITKCIEPTTSKFLQDREMSVSFNEGGSLDSSSDMDSFTEAIRKCGNPIHLPPKRQRAPKVPSAPPFALPPIQEDQISPKKEKKFDPSSFKFGLLKNSSRKTEAPSSLLKMQQIETKSKVIKRVSAEQSLLFKSLAGKKPHFQKYNHTQDDLSSASDSKRSRLETGKTLEQSSQLLAGPEVESTDLYSSLLKDEMAENENLRLNSRPGKMVIYSQPKLGGEAFEFFHDVQDATYLKLPSEISIRIVRGCWLLYEKPNFEGGKVALEEGVVELEDIWGNIDEDSSNNTSPSPLNEFIIGSIRRIVKEWCLPEIDLCTELDGLGRKTTYFDEVEEIQTYGILDPTLSLEVFSGTWLLFEEPFYQGNSYIVEVGQYPRPESWEATDPYISSLKPMKMGTLKVEKLHDHRVIVYEKPFFEGEQLEVKMDIFSFTAEVISSLYPTHPYPFTNIGSMKVLGGFWVGYEKPGFQGHQYALEEGEYQTWNEWGGYNENLQSLRFVQVDLSNPAMIIYNEANFCERSGSIEVIGPVAVLEETVHRLRAMSINVLSGTWVAYGNTDFRGEQYILEKGLYSTFEDWGATNYTIASLQPVLLDAMDNELSKFKVRMFSEPKFQGGVQIFDMDTVKFPDDFSPKSCEVLSGSWVACDAENFTGNQYILEEGIYPDLAAVGCIADSCIRSVRTIKFCFSMPGISLFTREKYEGRKIELISEVLNLKLMGYDTRIFSVKVDGGTWVAYECSNYRGRQVLLQPTQIPSWHQYSGWYGIGSLRPLIQKQVYFRLRNRGNGAFMTLTGEITDVKLIRVQALEDTGMDDQIWFYQDGYIKTKLQMAEDFCLDAIGSLIGVGSRLGISVLHSKDIHIWNISLDGVIWSRIVPELLIDVKGGQNYDKNQAILSKFDENRPTQKWDIEIL